MYKSLNKFLLIISSIIITVVLAACGTKSQTESQSDSQPKLPSSQEVIEKYTEVTKNIKSIKFESELTLKTIKNNEESVIKLQVDGTSSNEPLLITVNDNYTLTNKNIKTFLYRNESNTLYTKLNNNPWKKQDSNEIIDGKLEASKKIVASNKMLDFYKNNANDFKVEEQGENYILTYSGNDEKFKELLYEASASTLISETFKDIDLKNLVYKITLKKSSFEPVETSFSSESTKKESDNVLDKIDLKHTFSEINSAKVTKPEGIQ